MAAPEVAVRELRRHVWVVRGFADAGAVFHAMGPGQNLKPRMLRAHGAWRWDVLGAGARARTTEQRPTPSPARRDVWPAVKAAAKAAADRVRDRRVLVLVATASARRRRSAPERRARISRSSTGGSSRGRRTGSPRSPRRRTGRSWCRRCRAPRARGWTRTGTRRRTRGCTSGGTCSPRGAPQRASASLIFPSVPLRVLLLVTRRRER